MSDDSQETPDVPDLIEDVSNNVTPTNFGVYFQNGVLNDKYKDETLLFSGNFENLNQLTIKSDNVKIFKGLRKELKKNNIDINIYLGNEIYIDNNIFDLIKENKISTLNNTEYVLVELPLNGIYNDYIDIFTSLINEGCKIVLAHPERYTSFQEDYNKILELEELGVLFQCNINSIINKYGNNSKKLFKRLLKDKKVTFLGTDIHKDVKDYSFIKKSIKKISKYVSEDYLNDILINNAKNIIK